MRSALLVVALASLAVLMSAAVVSDRTDSRAGDNSWDYLLLVVRWSGAACVGVDSACYVPSNVNDFILHGLWPNRNDNSYPSFCDNNDPFDSSQVTDLIPSMEAFWTDVLDQPGDTSFWSHEWDKHGTCAITDSKVGSQHSYFQAALDLRKQAAIMELLSSADITPSNTTSYTTSKVNSAVSAGSAPGYVYCAEDSTLQNAAVLSYVIYCVDTNLQFMECPAAFVKTHTTENHCGSSMLFPLAAGH
jgi:ribonuclease T2